MRAIPLTLTAGCSLLVGACATLPPEQVPLWEAAKECERRFSPRVKLQGIDRDGGLHFKYREDYPFDRDPFGACYQERLREKIKTVLAPGRLSLPGGLPAKTSVPVEVATGMVVVPVTLNEHHHATLLMDTGASGTVLRPALVNRLGVSVPNVAPRIIVTVIGGKIISMPVVRVHSLKVGDLAVEDLDVGVYDALPKVQGVDGVLGANFLNHFSFTVDRNSKQLTLEVRYAPEHEKPEVGGQTVPTGHPPGWLPGQKSPPKAVEPVLSPSPQMAKEQSPIGIGPVVAPVWTLGDEWTYRWESPRGKGTYVWSVDREEIVDGIEHYVIRSGQREIYYRKSDLASTLADRCHYL